MIMVAATNPSPIRKTFRQKNRLKSLVSTGLVWFEFVVVLLVLFVVILFRLDVYQSLGICISNAYRPLLRQCDVGIKAGNYSLLLTMFNSQFGPIK